MPVSYQCLTPGKSDKSQMKRNHLLYKSYCEIFAQTTEYLLRCQPIICGENQRSTIKFSTRLPISVANISVSN